MLRKFLASAAVTLLALSGSAWGGDSMSAMDASAQTAGVVNLPQLTVDPLMADATTAPEAAAPAPSARRRASTAK